MEILIKKVPSLASISKFFKPENESWLENFKSVFAKAFNSIKFFGTFSTILIFVFDKFSTVENLIKVDTGITGDYTTLGSYTYNFPKSYNKVLGVAINIYKTRTATTLENVYLSGFNNTGFTFIKDCVDNTKANTVKIAYTVFYI